MNLERVIQLFEVHIRQAKAPVMGAEPEVRIPESMARLYLEAMRQARSGVVPWTERRQGVQW